MIDAMRDFELGAYARWVYGVGRPHVFPSTGLAASTLAAAMVTAQVPEEGIGSHGVLVPTLWAASGEAKGRRLAHVPALLRVGAMACDGCPCPTSIVTAVQGLLSEVRDPDAEVRVGTPLPESTLNTAFTPSRITARLGEQPPRRRPKAILAIIDDGIPFAHRNLRDAEGRSRVAFCWLQGARAAERVADQTVLVGREYTAADIDALIARWGGDEDRLYADLEVERGAFPGANLDRFATHGSHVLDTAAGFRHAHPGNGSALADGLDELDVIAVQLPAPATIDTTGFGKDFFVLAALHYIFERADRLARTTDRTLERLPLIINFSYGFSGGAHDGRDQLERAIEALVQERHTPRTPTHLVMPAGNDFDARLFGEISREMLDAQAGDWQSAYRIPWRLQPSDRTSNYLEIWLPEGADLAGMTLELLDPSGRRVFSHVPQSPLGSVHFPLVDEASSAPIGQISFERLPQGAGGRQRIVIALAPTTREGVVGAVPRSGLWHVHLGGLDDVLTQGPIACRIQRDINPFGYAIGARQSYFDDPAHWDDVRRPNGGNPAAFIQRYGTINGLATHAAVTVVGGYVGSTGRPAYYSSAGESALAAQALGRVHCSAPSDSTPATFGVRGAGTRSGSTLRLDGTSTAAPQVARAMARYYLARDPLAPASSIGLDVMLGGRWRPVGTINVPNHNNNQRSARFGDGILIELS